MIKFVTIRTQMSTGRRRRRFGPRCRRDPQPPHALSRPSVPALLGRGGSGSVPLCSRSKYDLPLVTIKFVSVSSKHAKSTAPFLETATWNRSLAPPVPREGGLPLQGPLPWQNRPHGPTHQHTMRRTARTGAANSLPKHATTTPEP